MKLPKTATEEEVRRDLEHPLFICTHMHTQTHPPKLCYLSADTSQYHRNQRELCCSRAPRAAALRLNPQD